jgi:hypothetical protein
MPLLGLKPRLIAEATRQRECLDRRDYPLTTYAEIENNINLLIDAAAALEFKEQIERGEHDDLANIAE